MDTPNDGLSALMHMDMLDRHFLLAFAAVLIESLQSVTNVPHAHQSRRNFLKAGGPTEVLLKKSRILAIGLPGKIKGLTNEGNAP